MIYCILPLPFYYILFPDMPSFEAIAYYNLNKRKIAISEEVSLLFIFQVKGGYLAAL